MTDIPSLPIQSHQGVYQVHFLNSLEEVFPRFCALGAPLLVCDETILALYRKRLDPLLKKAPFLIVPATEEEKTWRGIERVCSWLQSSRASKASQLVAIGGGITQDLVAFSAHIFFRGIPWYFVPTTLLSMADSCIGSKCGINFNDYKNQLGAFHPPREVWLCTDFVDSLGDRDIASGYGEVLRLSLTASPSFFSELRTIVEREGLRNSRQLELIAKCLAVKKRVIEEDEHERDYRRILNYGHTFGHALEAITQYEIPHGLAVAWGMDLINFLSVQMGYLREELFFEVHDFIRKHLPFRLKEKISIEALVEKTKKDKKSVAGEITLALFEGMGKLKLLKTPWSASLIQNIANYLERYDVYGLRQVDVPKD